MREKTENEFLVNQLKIIVKNKISEEVDKEIDDKIKQFHQELIDRKDKYISEIMKGIRIFMEMENPEHCPRYKIEFENIYRVEVNND